MSYDETYRNLFDHVLPKICEELRQILKGYLEGVAHIDRISVRAKSPDRFIAKAKKEVDGELKYLEPLTQIQDQIGARIVVFYLSDVEVVSSIIEKYFHRFESHKYLPESEWEFGYFGKHYVLLLPTDIPEIASHEPDVPQCFELQIKTLFQHAWSEGNHDLGYKEMLGAMPSGDRRKLAFSSAQAWGADMIFDELYRSIKD